MFADLEGAWMENQRRHHLVYAVSHATALVFAVYVIATSVPALGYHIAYWWETFTSRYSTYERSF